MPVFKVTILQICRYDNLHNNKFVVAKAFVFLISISGNLKQSDILHN